VLIGRLWTESWPIHDPLLSLCIGGCLIIASLVGLRTIFFVWNRMSRATYHDVHTFPRWLVTTTAVAIPITAFLSIQTTTGKVLTWTKDGSPAVIAMATADMSEAELTLRPKDWKPFQIWLRDYRRQHGYKVDEDPFIPTESEMERWRLVIASLDAPDLKAQDLRLASLTKAFLPGSDLRRANARGAAFRVANLAGANLGCIKPPVKANEQGLGCADLRGADLHDAHLQGSMLEYAQMGDVNLESAHLQGALLNSAVLTGANLSRARAHGAELKRVRLQRALLYKTELHGADLFNARLHGANLSSSKLAGASLLGARLHGADLYKADLTGTDPRSAEFHGAYMFGAKLGEADCSRAEFDGAVLWSAVLLCKTNTLVQDKLRYAVGDHATRLPPGYWVWSCLPRTPGPDFEEDKLRDIIEKLDFHPATSDVYRRDRTRVGKELFCADGVKPEKIMTAPAPTGTDIPDSSDASPTGSIARPQPVSQTGTADRQGPPRRP
jgi:uncharacterized protein YjbI with pentapeptide repeats